MFAKLRALASNTDVMTMVAIAAVGWGLTQLGKAVQDRQESVMALTNKAAQLDAEIMKRTAYADEVESYILAKKKASGLDWENLEDQDNIVTGDGN